MNYELENQAPESSGILVVAHRGASAYERENTAAAMERAIVCGADMVEFDLRRTSDGVVVLFHDAHIQTLSGQRKKLSVTTFAEVSETARLRGYNIATFEEILRKFGGRIPMDIEIKEAGFESEVVRLLDEIPPEHDPVISSFKPEVLSRIKSINNSLRTGLIIGRYRFDKMSLPVKRFLNGVSSKSKYDSIHLHKSLVTRSTAGKLSKAGIPLYVWTVNDPDEIRRFLEYGVRGIISDMPDAVYDIRNRIKAENIPSAADRDRNLVEER